MFQARVPHVQTEAEAFWYLHLDAQQQSAFDEFSKQLGALGILRPGHDDKYTLLRFLKARQWDVARAVTFYSAMAKWRQEENIDHMQRTFTFPEREGVFKVYPHFLHKSDKYGRPVYIELLGQTYAKKILELTSLERIISYHICKWEALERYVLPACTQIVGKPIITKTVILDLKGLGMKNFCSAARSLLAKVAKMDQDNYPEHLGQMFIINTPYLFQCIWGVVNPLLEERTRKKIVILGTDYLPTLLQLVPEENLPIAMGGKSPLNMEVEEGPWVALAAQLKAQAKAADAAAGMVPAQPDTLFKPASLTVAPLQSGSDAADVQGGSFKAESMPRLSTEGASPAAQGGLPQARTFSSGD